MKKSVMKQWVKALRSGKYKQTRGRLKNARSGGMCCLGVLCDISGQSEWGGSCYLFNDTILPIRVQEWAGINSCDGSFISCSGRSSNLVLKNDGGHHNFNQIADVIEKNWKAL